MHIMEDFLPVKLGIGWSVASAPFTVYRLFNVNRKIKQEPEQQLLPGIADAFMFVLSALKMQSVTRNCSHPVGTGLRPVLSGPTAMASIGAVVLLTQTILLTHGCLTTLRANVFSMVTAGLFAALVIYHLAKAANFPLVYRFFLLHPWEPQYSNTECFSYATK